MVAQFYLPPSRILAGPILRRTERRSVSVWLATSDEVRIEGRVRLASRDATVRGRDVSPTSGPPLAHLGAGVADSRKLGKQLWVHLVSIELTPEAANLYREGYPTETFLQYELYRDGTPLDLSALAYPPFHAPTFFLRESGLMNVLHGSCRKLHGPGEDGLALADDILQWSAADLEQRPSALCLTGDQIYADDVSAVIAPHISLVARLLLGVDEKMPFGPPVSLMGCGVVTRRLEGVFTSNEMDHQLLGFGQFAAMYLMAWNETMWPYVLPRKGPCAPPPIPNKWEAKGAVKRVVDRVSESLRISNELEELEKTRQTLPRVRRALANLPTYMIMDDHEVTDDWNLNGEWHRRALQDPMARRAIANSMAAFWAFQGWGNDPQRFGSIGDLVKRSVVDGWTEAAEEEMIGQHWDFATPPHPVVFFLDTRTWRDYPPESPGPPFRWATSPPALLHPDALQAFLARVKALHHDTSSPLVVVAPAPVFGPSTLDALQLASSIVQGPEAQDFESWAANSIGLYGLKRAILEQVKPPMCVFFSGDVHFGYVAKQLLEELTGSKRSTLFVQFTSSACKNEPGWLGKRFLSGVAEGDPEKPFGPFQVPEVVNDLVWFPEDWKRFLGTLTPAEMKLLEKRRAHWIEGLGVLDWLRAGHAFGDAGKGLPFVLDKELAQKIRVAQTARFRETTTVVRPEGAIGPGFVTGRSNLGRFFCTPGSRLSVRCELWQRDDKGAAATVMTVG